MYPGKSTQIYTVSQVRALLDNSDSDYDESDNEGMV